MQRDRLAFQASPIPSAIVLDRARTTGPILFLLRTTFLPSSKRFDLVTVLPRDPSILRPTAPATILLDRPRFSLVLPPNPRQFKRTWNKSQQMCSESRWVKDQKTAGLFTGAIYFFAFFFLLPFFFLSLLRNAALWLIN